MTFFYNLNKKLDEIRATPELTHKQLNERDMSRAAKGYEKYGKQGMEALAKAGREGKNLDPVRKKYDKYDNTEVDESMGDIAKKMGALGKKVGGAVLNKLGHGDDEDMRKDLQRKMGVPKQQQHGKPSMAKSNEDYGPMEGGAPMTPKQKSFAALAEPKDKITFADKIAGAKKEVDEMLGDVAAEAIKSALTPKQQKLDKNNNGKLDANDFAMLRKGGKKEVADESFPTVASARADAEQMKIGDKIRGHKGNIEKTDDNTIRHTRRYDNKTGETDTDDEGNTKSGEKRGRGRPAGTGSKMGAKGPSGRSKLMTKENDVDPADKGEYDQEGEMAKDSIQTVVRHAQALEKILGDNDNLPEWVQSKLAKIEGMMTAVDDYMQNQAGDEEMDGEQEPIAEKAVSKKQQRFMGMVSAAKKGEKPASKEVAKVAKTMKKDDAEDFASTKHKGLPEKKKPEGKKKEKTEEAGGAETPTASSGFNYGKGIYDSMNRELENMIAESMSVNMSDSTEGSKSLTITATDDDALKLAGLLKNAGLGGGEPMSQEMGSEETCSSCGMSSCGCGDVQEALDENNPDWPTNTETSNDALQYSGGMNGPKSTGQSTIPVLASQEDRQHTYEENEALRRMMEMAGVQQDNLTPWERTMKEEAQTELDEAEKCSACDCDPCECDESVTESFEQMLTRMRDIAGIKEGKKPDFLDMDKDGDKKEPMAKAVKDKEKKVEESIFALTNQWKAYKG